MRVPWEEIFNAALNIIQAVKTIVVHFINGKK
jgi:hypothetical protein